MTRGPIALLLLILSASPAAAQSSCDAPAPVCDAQARVLMMSGYEPVGSAVILDDGLLVTNRHMVADNGAVEVRKPDGKTVWAKPVPTDYAGDLILLSSPEIKLPSPWKTARASSETELYVIGFDVGRDAIRVYAPGRLIVPRADRPLARLHHDARSLPGNSGGALVDAEGRLVGIVASGGEGRNEAVPQDQLKLLEDASGPLKRDPSAMIGAAVRQCVEGLDAAQGAPAPLPSQQAATLQSDCLESGNRQLFDLAAQALSKGGHLKPALTLLKLSVEQDPNAPNTLLTLAITYHLAQLYADEIPVVRRALELMPDDPQLLRLALQAGIWGGDQALADDAIKRIEEVLPQMAPAARKFYEMAPPAPKLTPKP